MTKELLAQQLLAKGLEAAALQEQLTALQSAQGAAAGSGKQVVVPQQQPGNSANSSPCLSPRGAASPAASGQGPLHADDSDSGGVRQGGGATTAQLQQRKPSFAARLMASWGHKQQGGSTAAVGLLGGEDNSSSPGAAAVAAVSDADLAQGAADGTTTTLQPLVGGAGILAPADGCLISAAAGSSLTASNASLATQSKACPGVQELVQHFEVVTGLDRNSVCSLTSAVSTGSIGSAQSEPVRLQTDTTSQGLTRQQPGAGGDGGAGVAASPSPQGGWLRPSPLPRVATVTRGGNSATTTGGGGDSGVQSPKSPASPAGLRVGGSALGSPTAAGASRSAFGRSAAAPQAGQLLSASASFTSRFPFGGSIGSVVLPTPPKSPSMSAAASGASTPAGRATVGGSGSPADLAASVSKGLTATAAAAAAAKKKPNGSAGGSSGVSAKAAGATRIPAVGITLTRTGSSSSSTSKGAAPAGGAASAGPEAALPGSSLRKQLSRLVPGSSNGSVGSERSSGGGGGGGIFKHKPGAGGSSAAASRVGGGASAGVSGKKGLAAADKEPGSTGTRRAK